MSTRTQLVIEGDLVTKLIIEESTYSDGSVSRRETTKGTVKLDSMLEQLITARGTQQFNPKLTNGHLLAQKSEGIRLCVVVEFAPAIRRVLEAVDVKHQTHARQLAFPWVYLVVKFNRGLVDNMSVYYRNEKATSADAEVFYPNLPNIYESNKICTGSMSGVDASWPLDRKLDWITQSFWDSIFNQDLRDTHWDPSCRRILGHPYSFAEWEEKSQTDPSFILGLNWRTTGGTTIQTLLDKGVK